MVRYLIGSFLALLIVAFSSPVWACSPPFEELELLVAERARPDAIGIYFRVNDSGFRPENLEGALTLEGEEIDGTFANVEVDNAFVGLMAFVPGEPLTIGEVYELELATPDVPTDSTTTTTTTQVEIIEAGAPSLGELEPSWARNWSAANCCSTEEGGCFDSCGECTVCWPESYVYGPELRAEVQSDFEAVFVRERLLIDGVQQRSDTGVFAQSRPAISLQHTPNQDVVDFESVCLEVDLIAANGDVVTESKCLDRSAFPDVPEEQIEARDKIAQCAEEPDNTEDVQWQRHKGESKLADEGCSTTSGSPGLAVLLLSLLGFLRIRRG